MRKSIKVEVLRGDFLTFSRIRVGPGFIIANCALAHTATTRTVGSLHVATSTVLGVARRIDRILLVFPLAELLGRSAVTEFGTADVERAFLLAFSSVWSALSFRIALYNSSVKQAFLWTAKLTVMLTSISAKVLGVSTKICFAATSAIGAWRTSIASASR